MKEINHNLVIMGCGMSKHRDSRDARERNIEIELQIEEHKNQEKITLKMLLLGKLLLYNLSNHVRCVRNVYQYLNRDCRIWKKHCSEANEVRFWERFSKTIERKFRYILFSELSVRTDFRHKISDTTRRSSAATWCRRL